MFKAIRSAVYVLSALNITDLQYGIKQENTMTKNLSGKKDYRCK